MAKPVVNVSLQEYINLYQLSLSYEGKSPKTLVVYLGNLNRFHKYLAQETGRTPLLADLNEKMAMAYVTSLKQVGKWQGHPFVKASSDTLSPHTVHQHVRCLKGFATWLFQKKYTKTNLLHTLERPKVPTLVIEPLREEEIKAVLASLDTKTAYGARNYTIILLFLDTGLRCSELCNMTVDDVHLEGRHNYVKVMGKGSKERIVYLGKRCVEAMLSYRTFVRPHYCDDRAEKHFFVSHTGRVMTVSGMDTMMKKVGAAAGVPRLHPHLLRHTSATQYLAGGGDVISLQHKLGHSGLEMTNHYVHLALDQQEAIQERVSPMDRLDIKRMKVPRTR